jgi:hypothetical protein
LAWQTPALSRLLLRLHWRRHLENIVRGGQIAEAITVLDVSRVVLEAIAAKFGDWPLACGWGMRM